MTTKLVILCGQVGCGRSTLGNKITRNNEEKVGMADIQTWAAECMGIILSCAGSIFTGHCRYSSAGIKPKTSDKKVSYRELLADFYVSQRVVMDDCIWAAKLMFYLKEQQENEKTRKKLWIIDNVCFRSEIEFLKASGQFDVALVMCEGDPGGVVEQAGAYIKELTADCAIAEKEADVCIDTELDDSDATAAYLAHKINERWPELELCEKAK